MEVLIEREEAGDLADLLEIFLAAFEGYAVTQDDIDGAYQGFEAMATERKLVEPSLDPQGVPAGEFRRLPADQVYMPELYWGPGAQMPVLADDAMVYVNDRGPNAPDGRYAVLGFDPDTTERYWVSRPKGERERLLKQAAE
jgi:hypothetical protein